MSVLEHLQPTSPVAPAPRGPSEAIVTGFLIDSVFGTNAGVAVRSLRSDVFGVTTVPSGDPRPPGMRTLAEEIRELRDSVCATGISRQELARLLGVDRRSLSGWVRGDIRPTRERVDMLRSLARTVAEIDDAYPDRAAEVLLASRGTTTLLDAVIQGRTRLEQWRSWLRRASAAVTVTPRHHSGEPIWAAAARALAQGRLAPPTWARTVRPASTYETQPDQDAEAFSEADYESGRRDYQ